MIGKPVSSTSSRSAALAAGALSAQTFSGAAALDAVIGQAVAFGLAHFYQGPVGMFPIAVGAVLYGTASVAWGRNLWPVMIAHGLVDTLGFTMLYLGIPLS